MHSARAGLAGRQRSPPLRAPLAPPAKLYGVPVVGGFLYPLLAAIFLWQLANYALERRVFHRRWQQRLGGKTAGAADFVQNVQALAALLDSNLAHERLLLAERARQ